MDSYPITPRSRLRRRSDRGLHDRRTVRAIIDEALVAHVGFTGPDGQPYVIPTSHARVDDTIYFHGAHGSRLLRALQSGAPVCVSFTLLDGLVLARSWTNHSVNYRSAVVFGRGRKVTDPAERQRALRGLVEHAVPGRTADTRPPTPSELRITGVAALDIDEASAKVRAEGPHDEPDDFALDAWAGVLPVAFSVGPPVPSEDLAGGISPPGYVTDYRRPAASRPSP